VIRRSDRPGAADSVAADQRAASVRIGLISDTHGLLRPQALAALAGSDFLIHAGDIGDAAILERLRDIAPLTAVRGNNDVGAWAAELGETAILEVGTVRILVLHDITMLRRNHAETVQAVVSGHSHRPLCSARDGVLFVNPGSAGPRRFSLPICVGVLHVARSQVRAELIELDS